jgi:hypothetical protein
VEGLKAEVGDSRWVSPEVWRLPIVQGSVTRWWAVRGEGGNRRKWGLEEDLSWFRTCPDTAWKAKYFATRKAGAT